MYVFSVQAIYVHGVKKLEKSSSNISLAYTPFKLLPMVNHRWIHRWIQRWFTGEVFFHTTRKPVPPTRMRIYCLPTFSLVPQARNLRLFSVNYTIFDIVVREYLYMEPRRVRCPTQLFVDCCLTPKL